MSYRNSLTKCIDMIGQMYSSGIYKHLSILQVPGGKYYKIMTDADLEVSESKPEEQNCRLVFRGTFRELATFLKAREATLELFKSSGEEQSPL